MTPQQIAADIERGIVIKAEMARLKTELDAIEKRLEAAGLISEQVPLQNPNLEGKQFIARSANHVLPVRFESDLIAGSFAPDSPMHKEVAAITGTLISKFFKRTAKFERVQKEGEAFRKQARALLDPESFAKLIQAVTQRSKDGIAKSKTVIAWDEAKPLDHAPV
jgi:hypothetical protein